MNEQNAQGQKKLYNKIRSIPSKSNRPDLTLFSRPITTPEIIRVDDKYTYV